MQQTSNALVLALIGLNNKSNKKQVSKSQFSTSQETAADGDVKMPLKAQCLPQQEECLQSIEFCFLYVAYVR